MGERDQLLETIGQVYAAAHSPDEWPRALASMARLLGGVAATLEDFEKPSWRLAHFAAHNIPEIGEGDYARHFALHNPRLPALMRARGGHVSWDYQFIDEAEMTSSPFYADFLNRDGFRYFLGGTIKNTAREYALFSVQRSRAQGHADGEAIALAQALIPHVMQAHDMSRRFRDSAGANVAFEEALDQVADGVALLHADGAIAHANASLRAMAQRGDGLQLRQRRLEFASQRARMAFARALSALEALRAGSPDAVAQDFIAPRTADLAPYVVSVRPLAHRQRGVATVAAVFIRDPACGPSLGVSSLRDAFGLTEAEARLAAALQAGRAPGDYARESLLSLNTVYTHLRRLREKTGCHRISDLIRKLNELRPPTHVRAATPDNS